ncbi:hypothetical protein AGMMS49965_24820 [Bacteroidia bacterium]|nr:hypothetical protein AGMMS49965_24820 [Bacteroidia bacterium]
MVLCFMMGDFFQEVMLTFVAKLNQCADEQTHLINNRGSAGVLLGGGAII